MHYGRVLLKSWWLILAITLVGLTAALMTAYTRKPIYNTSSIYAVTPVKLPDTGSTLDELDTLSSGQQRIFATYCQVITSQETRQQAVNISNIDPNSFKLTDYTVGCSVLANTNAIQITVQGPVPSLASRLNGAIGTISMGQVQNLYYLYPMQQIDAVKVADKPVSPNYVQSAILGALLGLLMGVLLVLWLSHMNKAEIQLADLVIDTEPLIYNSALKH